MAIAWTARGLDPRHARTRIVEAAAREGIPEFARIEWEGDRIRVRIDRGGQSEFRLAIVSDGDGVRVAEAGREVAFLHRVFVSRVEAYLDRILAGAGFRRT